MDDKRRRELNELKPDAYDDEAAMEAQRREVEEVILALERDHGNTLRDRAATLRNVMLDAGVGLDRFDEMMGSPEIVLDVAIEFFEKMKG